MAQPHFEIDPTITIILSSAIVAMLLQLWLCRKAKRILIKLIPIALLTLSTIGFSVCSAYIGGWDSFGYLFFALLSFGLIWVCGVSWFFCAAFGKSNC